LESLVHDKPQKHQSSLLPQPLVSIELSEPSQVQKNVTPLTQKNNVNTNYLLSELVKRHPNIHLPGRLIDNLESENRSLNEEIADKLLELPVKAFNISNKNEELYFYVDKDEERDKETVQLRQT
ncbi:9744_t:CDS:2, partial [Gigaspora margarita]